MLLRLFRTRAAAAVGHGCSREAAINIGVAGGARRAPNEVCAGSAERSGKQQYEGTLQRPEYISRRAARPLGSAPRAFAVSGISCITPMAPFGDTALGSKSDSVFATFCTQAA